MFMQHNMIYVRVCVCECVCVCVCKPGETQALFRLELKTVTDDPTIVNTPKMHQRRI